MESNYWMRRPVGRRSVLRGAAALSAGTVGAVLIGCGGDDDDGDATTGPTTAPTTAVTPASTEAVATTAPDAVKRGGTLKFEIAGDPPNFDMHSNSTYLVNNPMGPLHNLLVQFDPFIANEPAEAVIPDLAKSWTLDDDLTITFDLVENAKYHDGQSFTSADVKASFERVWNPPDTLVSPREANGDAVESIETPDDYHVTFNLSRPNPSLLPLMAQGWNVMYSHENIDGDFDIKLEVNGTGPYRLDNYQRGNRLETSRNPDYHVADRPYLDGVTIFVIPDASTRTANFQSGELDIFRGPSVTDAKTMVEALGDKIVLDGPMPSNGFSCINFNTSKEPWNDNRVREAIAMSMDRPAARNLLAQGEGFEGGYFNPSGGWASSLESIQTVPGYRPFSDDQLVEARKRLDAAGVPEGFEATILTRNISEDLSLYIADMASKIGISMALDVQESASAYDRLNTRNFDLAPWGHGYALDDPDAVFGEFYITGAARNYSELSTPEIDDLYARQTVELDIEARAELAHQMEVAAVGQYGKIVTHWSSTRELRWSYVKNRVKHPSTYNNVRWEDVWLDV